MKVSRVSEAGPVSEQNSNSRCYPGSGISFRIQPPLESDGDSSADGKQHEHADEDGEGCRSIANHDDSCCHVVAELFPLQQESDHAATDDSLESLLNRIRRAHRLDLRI